MDSNCIILAILSITVGYFKTFFKIILIYLGRVIVGTPPKEYRVVFDTGSTQFWIMSSKCRVETKNGKPCTGKSLYNKHKSNSYRKRAGRFSQIYEIGFAYGDFAQDTVAVSFLDNTNYKCIYLS